MHIEPLTERFFLEFLAVLTGLSAVSLVLKQFCVTSEGASEAIRRLNRHLRNLWGTVLIFGAALLTGGLGTLLVFGVSSFLLLREFVTITPTRRPDHPTLFWLFFVILPLQYIILGCRWYGLFVIFIPVYGFLFLPIRMAAAGDSRNFLERAARLQWAMMLCIYCISHAPALMILRFPGNEGAGARLLLFMCLITEANNTAHECFDVFGKRLIDQSFQGRTLKGMMAGLAAGAVIGVLMSPMTPMSPLQAAGMAVMICLLGSAGQLCLSVIRAERGSDSVVVVRRNNEMMPRVISLCFAAPFFFHFVRHFLTGTGLDLF